MIATTRRAALLSAFATVGAGALAATPRSARAAEIQAHVISRRLLEGAN